MHRDGKGMVVRSSGGYVFVGYEPSVLSHQQSLSSAPTSLEKPCSPKTICAAGDQMFKYTSLLGTFSLTNLNMLFIRL